ncbi:MAG: two-component system response regulator CreB [Verrucomicrobiae bacterium]|nr:two-component system response regulator CreB [Verrucomicrobiae bacterium]
MASVTPQPPCRVLVVEDEPSIAENIEYSLRTEGFEVTLAGTGEEALSILAETGPGFVILDVGLPGMSGFDVCREIRHRSNVPVLFLTAREGEIDRVVGLELGADDYVVKPFSPRELAARVRAILRRTAVVGGESVSQASTGKPSAVGLVIDPERRRASWNGTTLNLARYEFGLAEVFAAHPGRVYTRDQLMDLVWDEPEASLDRTVDAHIKSLRAKLRDAGGPDDLIVTHRGVGYSWKEPA